VLRTINLNHQSMLVAVEVDDVLPDLMLAPKFRAGNLPTA